MSHLNMYYGNICEWHVMYLKCMVGCSSTAIHFFVLHSLQGAPPFCPAVGGGGRPGGSATLASGMSVPVPFARVRVRTAVIPPGSSDSCLVWPAALELADARKFLS